MIIRSSDQVPRVTALKRFPVPRNFVFAESRIMRQRTWPAPASTRVKALEVYRYDPNSQGNPHLGTSPELSAPSRFGPPRANHLTARLGIGIAPGLKPNWLPPALSGAAYGASVMGEVTGGCAAHFQPRADGIPIAVRVSGQAGQGLFGLGLGALTPVFMLTRLPAASTSATARPPWFPR